MCKRKKTSMKRQGNAEREENKYKEKKVESRRKGNSEEEGE
jgi:hypothetical protein